MKNWEESAGEAINLKRLNLKLVSLRIRVARHSGLTDHLTPPTPHLATARPIKHPGNCTGASRRYYSHCRDVLSAVYVRSQRQRASKSGPLN